MRVYSFGDTVVTVMHPAVGQKVLSGTGMGDVVTSYAGDASSHTLSNDGRVITSKIKAPNGTVTVNLAQNSDGFDWMKNLYNYLVGAPSAEWNQILVTIKAPGEFTTCHGASFQKFPDVTRGQQAQMIPVVLLAEEITQEG